MLLDEDIERQSTCELEIDVVAADILNRLEVGGELPTYITNIRNTHMLAHAHIHAGAIFVKDQNFCSTCTCATV